MTPLSRADDGVLADLDKVAVSIAVKNSSPSKEITPTHPVRARPPRTPSEQCPSFFVTLPPFFSVEQDAQTSKALPPAPVKTARHSILRRVSSINCPIALPALRSSSSFHAAIGTAEVAAAVASEETATRRVTARRRLTWNDRKGTLGELEHVQWFDVYDGFGTCANVGPDAGASTPGGGGVRRRKSTGGATDASACSFDSKATRVTSISAALSSAERGGLGSGWGSFDADPFAFETAHDAASGLDPAARTAVRRIASTLARHERDGVDVRGMTNAERCGKMLKRKITSKAAALVEGAAAAAAVEDARTYLRGNDPHMMPENHRKRPVVTAGDAILTWVVSAAAAKKRERVELDARNAELQERVLTLLSEVDAMADAVPSRRIAAGLRDLHRMRLQVFDSRSKARAMEAAVAHLRCVLLCFHPPLSFKI